MGLQLSTKSQEPAPAYGNSPRQGNTDIELAHVSVNIYDSLERGDRDEHTYGVAGVAASENVGKVRPSSEVTLSRSVIVLVVVGMILISTVISIISGVVVYHVTNGKITETSQEETSSRRLDSLEQTLVNASRQLDTLERTQVNTSVYMETLTEEHTTTNRQLEIWADKQNIAGQQVAFSVYRLRQNLTSDGTPLFSHTAVNTGQYNTSSGRFLCPLAGLYYFSFSFEHNSGDSGEARCYFVVNGAISVYVYVAVRQSPYEAASGSVIQHLSVNDTVRLSCSIGWQYVQTRQSNAVFSGFLIAPD